MGLVARAVAASLAPVVMIWDARDMTDYDRAARGLWQGMMKQLEPRLVGVHVISSAALIRMGARVIGSFMGYRIRAWHRLDEVQP